MPVKRLHGEELRTELRLKLGEIRVICGVPTNYSTVDRTQQTKFNATFGKDFGPITRAAAKMYRGSEKTGVFARMSLPPVAYDERLGDIEDTEDCLQMFASFQDVLAGWLQAQKVETGEITQELIATRQDILDNRRLNPDAIPVLSETGRALDVALEERKGWVNSRRAEAGTLRETQATLEETQAAVKDYQTKETAKHAQKDLKIQYLSGEQLRPEDLVVPDAAPPGAGAPTAAEKPARPRRPASGRARLTAR